MVTIRLADAQAVSDVMLALRRDAAQNRVIAQQWARRGDAVEKVGRMIAVSERLEELAERIDGQLTVSERVMVARCGS